jgi:uncharacterized protein YbjQ (UPF0145 family)
VDLLSDAVGELKTLVGASSGLVGRYALTAADRAMWDMQRDAQRMGADAVVGVTVNVMPSVTGVRHVVLASAMGTAVKLVPEQPSDVAG